MDEKKRKIIKISFITILSLLVCLSVILASVLIATNKKLEQANKDNQEIIKQLENMED